jgi:hypothetical protein
MVNSGNPSPGPDYSWMRVVLAVLYDEYTPQAATDCIRDPAKLEELRFHLNDKLDALENGPIPPGDRGDNLLQAILALRIKFPREEAVAKLEQNIAMRQESSS